jgi:hypothetical protein
MINVTYKLPPPLIGGAAYAYPPSAFFTEMMVKSFMQVGAPMRRAVRKIERSFTQNGNKFGPEGPCVAVHIRLGDKVPECLEEKKETSCSFLSALPLYIPKAKELLKQLPGFAETSPGAIFVMTDNDTVIEDLQKQHPDVQIDGLRGSSPNRLQEADGSHQLATLLASLQIASRCGAFVGNSESEVSELAILLSCYTQGQCPAVYSFQNGPAGSTESRLNGDPVAPSGILSLLKVKGQDE